MFSPLMIISLDAGRFSDFSQHDGPHRYELVLAALRRSTLRMFEAISNIGTADAEFSGRVAFSGRRGL